MPATPVISLDGTWMLAPDPDNVGREQRWWSADNAPQRDAKPAKVPWIIQDVFPGYHGVAWYWRQFVAPDTLPEGGRTLLRLWAVDYLAEVWLNGIPVGGHEGAETPFVLDVTEALRPGESNHLAVRVLNPTNEPIDGIVLNETPHRNKVVPYSAGSAWNIGGITDSVELLQVPQVRICDLFVRADPATGLIRAETTLYNAGSEPQQVTLELSIAPATSGPALATIQLPIELPPGETQIESRTELPHPHLWELNDPYLYRATVRVEGAEASTRFGFRDLRFADGAFRLNGQRILLRCSHTGNCCPIGLEIPHDPDFLRRDLLNAKVMGFNAIRFIAGIPKRYQLDLCDEIGLMVYDESYAGWCMADSPQFVERYDRSMREMVIRDRNHPSVVIWGMLNETSDGPVLRHAVEALKLVRQLDDTRLVMLNSGRFDCVPTLGSLCNPGSETWEYLLGAEAPDAPPTAMGQYAYCEHLGDVHIYPRVPHTAETISLLRTFGSGDGRPVLLTEYGIGSAVDLVRLARHYERLGAEYADDAQYYRVLLERFLVDWQRWRLAEVFGRPEDYFAACVAKMARQRLLGLNALRANPYLAGYSVTGTVDQGMTGEGLWTTFREFKPGTMDAMADGFAPLRLCLFAESQHVYRTDMVRLEAVLANEDALAPGEYSILLQVFAPDGAQILRLPETVVIPDRNLYAETPLAIPVSQSYIGAFAMPGRYRFVAAFEHGAAAAGGEAEFFVTDAAAMPPVDSEITLWGQDDDLAKWLGAYDIQARPFAPDSPAESCATPRILSDAEAIPPAPAVGEVILAGQIPPEPGGAEAFRALLARVQAGATVVFLCPEVFAEGENASAHLPVAGRIEAIHGWLYLKDEWARRHPIFDGLPSGGLMDYGYYREIIPDLLLMDADPAEVVAGAMKTSQDYSAGLTVAVYEYGAGRIIINTLLIRENLGQHPAAERLLRNMLRYASGEALSAG